MSSAPGHMAPVSYENPCHQSAMVSGQAYPETHAVACLCVWLPHQDSDVDSDEDEEEDDGDDEEEEGEPKVWRMVKRLVPARCCITVCFRLCSLHTGKSCITHHNLSVPRCVGPWCAA